MGISCGNWRWNLFVYESDLDLQCANEWGMGEEARALVALERESAVQGARVRE